MRRYAFPLSTLGLILFAGLYTPGYSAYGLGPSTGTNLPFSVQFKNNLKNLFHNASFIGGQVIALRDTPGKEYSGNYIDVGDLGGVKEGDVFALFSSKGEPVGFIKITEVQRYTSSFEFLELTVTPSDELVAKKVTNEIRDRLPSMLAAHPDMRRYHEEIRVVRTKRKPAMVPVPQSEVSSANTSLMPPLPGQSSTALPPLPGTASSSALPPLPGTAPSSSALPALPGSADNNLASSPGLPPLPGPAPAVNSSVPPLPQSASTSPSSLPPLTGDNNPVASSPNALPPLPGDNSMLNSSTSLPPVPATATTDNSAGLPPLSSDSGSITSLPPLATSTDNSTVPPMPTGASAGGVGNSDLPPFPVDNSGASTVPSIPSGTTDNTLPGMDNSSPGALPPLPQSELPGTSLEPIAQESLPPVPEQALNSSVLDGSQALLPSSGLDSNSAMPDVNLPAPQPDMAGLQGPDFSATSGLTAAPENNPSLLPVPEEQVSANVPNPEFYRLPVPETVESVSAPGLPDNSISALPSPNDLAGLASPVIPSNNLAALPNPTESGIPPIPDASMAALPMNVPPEIDNGLPSSTDMNKSALPPSFQNDTIPPVSGNMAMEGSNPLPLTPMDHSLPPTSLSASPVASNESFAPPMPVVSSESASIPGLDDFQVPSLNNPAGAASSAEVMNLGLPSVPTRVDGRFLQDLPNFTVRTSKPSA